MAKFSVILVEPQTPGNIGAIARLMGNFSLADLYLVDPVPVDDEAFTRAMHAKDILNNAEIVDDYAELVENFDQVIGTSGIETVNEKKFLRKAETPDQIVEEITDREGDIALVFGREDQGLLNEELKKCDRLVRIPASEEYPILNLSHAVCVVLYELFKEREEVNTETEDRPAGKSDRERLIESFSEIVREINFPEHKYEKTEVMFRKILGRANLTRWEYHRMMGIFSQILKEIES